MVAGLFQEKGSALQNFTGVEIEVPRDTYSYQKAASELRRITEQRLGNNELNRFLTRTPGFCDTYNNIQREISEKISSGALSKQQGEKILGTALIDASSYICSADQLLKKFIELTHKGMATPPDLGKVSPSKSSTETAKQPEKSQPQTLSEEIRLQERLKQMTFGNKLPDREFNSLVKLGKSLNDTLNEIEKLVNQKIESKTISKEKGVWIIQESIAQAVSEILPIGTSREQRIKQLVEIGLKKEESKKETPSNSSSTSNPTNGTASVAIPKTNNIFTPEGLFDAQSKRMLDSYGTNALDQIKSAFSASEFDVKNGIATSIKATLDMLDKSKEITLDQKRSVVCTAARDTEKEIGFRKVTPKEFTELFLKNINIRYVETRDGHITLSPEQIESLKQEARKLMGNYIVAVRTYTPPPRRPAVPVDREKELLSHAPEYRQKVEALLRIGTLVLSDPKSFRANEEQLERALEEFSKIPAQVVGENLPRMAEGLASSLRNSYDSDMNSVDRAVLKGIINGINQIYDKNNHRLLFETVTEKRIAKTTAQNLMTRLNLAASDPRRLDYARDGEISQLRRANIAHDISVITSFLQKDYNRTGLGNSPEVQTLYTLGAIMRGNATFSGPEGAANLDILRKAQSFISELLYRNPQFLA